MNPTIMPYTAANYRTTRFKALCRLLSAQMVNHTSETPKGCQKQPGGQIEASSIHSTTSDRTL